VTIGYWDSTTGAEARICCRTVNGVGMTAPFRNVDVLETHRRFHTQAQQELELIRARHRVLTEELIDTLADVLRVMESNPPDAEVGRHVKSAVADHGEIGELLAGCNAIAAYSGDNHLPLLWRFYRSHRPVLFRMARTLHFEATTQERTLLQALDVVLAHEDAHGDCRPVSLTRAERFATWRQAVGLHIR
jgi:hypothetical protein